MQVRGPALQAHDGAPFMVIGLVEEGAELEAHSPARRSTRIGDGEPTPGNEQTVA